MAQPRRRRWSLLALSVAALFLLVYASIYTAFSITVGADSPEPGHEGQRAFVRPLEDPMSVANGTLLVLGHSETGFPSGSTDARVVRMVSANETGFMVSEHNNTSFAPRADVLGPIVRYEDPLLLYTYFGAGGLGFIAPLVVLVVTHRGTASRPGAPGPLACPECRAPIAAGAEFCTRCGAWLTKKGEAP